MSWIWILPALLGFVLIVTLHPLFSRLGGAPLPTGLEENLLVELEDRRDILLRQLKELELDGAGGTTTAADQDSFRAELEEALGNVLDRLQEVSNAATSLAKKKNPENSRSAVDMAAGVAVLLGIMTLSGGLYFFLGTPFPPSLPAAEHATPHGPGGAAPDMNALVARLAARMRQNPDDLEGHLRLGRAYTYLERFNEAMDVYTHILTRDPQHVEAAAGLAGILVESDQKDQFKRGLELFHGILQRQPDNPEALWVLGAVAFRAGDRKAALEMWQKLLPSTPPGSTMRQEVEQAINKAEAMPVAQQKTNSGTQTSP
ncbi:MAG: tetratricopeptide repeat protein [Magnetococcales bacterium]|nr:tetratricopeptide repeat protein [Magnetococcales bacterium]MBF0322045.1 tetratricopeptide repeat protein [Magnetococcales bacterium]